MHFTTAIFFATVASFFSDASAIPVQDSHLKARDATTDDDPPIALPPVTFPPITFPTSDSVFLPGQTIVVTWNVTDVLGTASLLLGQKVGSVPRLTVELASGVSVGIGNQSVTIPSNTPPGNYVIGLENDLGLIFTSVSPEFNIPVIFPQITFPTSDSVFLPGQTTVVTWNFTDVPGTASLLLGQKIGSVPELTVELASDVSLGIGNQSVVIPSNTLPGNYVFGLKNDFTSVSPEFSIQALAG